MEPVTGQSEPQQHQIIDIENEGSGALRSRRNSVLGILESEQLLDVAKADLQGPAPGEGGEDGGGVHGEVGGEKAIVATAASGIAHDDDAE